MKGERLTRPQLGGFECDGIPLSADVIRRVFRRSLPGAEGMVWFGAFPEHQRASNEADVRLVVPADSRQMDAIYEVVDRLGPSWKRREDGGLFSVVVRMPAVLVRRAMAASAGTKAAPEQMSRDALLAEVQRLQEELTAERQLRERWERELFGESAVLQGRLVQLQEALGEVSASCDLIAHFQQVAELTRARDAPPPARKKRDSRSR